jgi:tripartite-type tricarboxylate transporter receptor subunit TctC
MTGLGQGRRINSADGVSGSHLIAAYSCAARLKQGAITCRRSPFQRHENWDSVGVARGDIVKLSRHQFLHLAAGAAALPVASRVARAQTYPARPVRIIVPFAPAGAPDIVARLMGQWLSERLGRPFVIENRPGASSLGTEAVVRSPADGYTLLMVGTQNAISATLYDQLNFVFLRDIAPIAGIVRVPHLMVVHPSVPAKTVPEFIAMRRIIPASSTWPRPAPER